MLSGAEHRKQQQRHSTNNASKPGQVMQGGGPNDHNTCYSPGKLIKTSSRQSGKSNLKKIESIEVINNLMAKKWSPDDKSNLDDSEGF